MKRTISPIFALCLTLSSIGWAQEPAGEMKPKKEKTEKVKKAKAEKPTADADIEKCINDKFASNSSMQGSQAKATVSSGVATLTGEAKTGGTKGGATRSAKACGATKVNNEMTVAASAKKMEKEKTEKEKTEKKS